MTRARSTTRKPAPASPRHDGWTPEKQRGFIAALAETGCVSDAAEAVGMTPQGARRLRSRHPGSYFAEAWSVALGMGLHRLRETVIERAIHGIAVPHYYRGEKVGESRRYNDRVALQLLTRYGRAGVSPTGRMLMEQDWDATLDRLSEGEGQE